MIVSSATIANVSRNQTSRLQGELLRAQDELASGRRRDIGLSDGARAVSATLLRAKIEEGDAFVASNRLVAARLTAADGALASLTSAAQTVQNALLQAGSGAVGAPALAQHARAALDQVVAIANATFDGGSLFSGLNGGAAPLNAFSSQSPTGPAQALQAAFVAKFGTAPGSPASASIAPSDMLSFLDGEFSALFEDPGWNAHWSNASDEKPDFRISESASIQDAVTGNDRAIRDVVKSLAMAAGLGVETLSAETRQAVLTRAAGSLGQALSGLSGLSAELGLKSNVVADASKQIELQQTQLKGRLDDVESADPAEVSTRLSLLSAQLQASYQITAKLAKLSLVNFI